MNNTIQRKEYQNIKTGEIRSFDVVLDETGHAPMYYEDENNNEWKVIPKWSLTVVNSGEFFASAHESRVKFTKPPLDGSDFPYGVT